MRTLRMLVAVALIVAGLATVADATHSAPHTLTVVVSGSGSVTSNDGGIDCPGDCTQSYATAVSVTLTASSSASWDGSVCSGTTGTTCTVTMSNHRTITATFSGGGGGGIVMAGAGDICGNLTPCMNTSNRVIDVNPDIVTTYGDLAYNDGLLSEFNNKYDPRWGRAAIYDETMPGYGNHDCYDVPRSTGATKQGCDGAVSYFGTDAQIVSRIDANTPCNATDLSTGSVPGTYSAVCGDWLLVSLNSAGNVGSGQATSAEVSSQNTALQTLLANDSHTCELLYWHHARWANGDHENNPHVDPWWDTAVAQGVDVVLNGHAHSYERFPQMNAAGNASAGGTREFVIGTGGAGPDGGFANATPATPDEQLRDYGIGVFELNASSYDFEFLDDQTGAVDDSIANVSCHN